ncbi:MAG: flagellar export chaperone FlgN [Verrucomicrobiota bacterium]|jgi:flagellar biosynthesis/type III secretory pathway chaperone
MTKSWQSIVECLREEISEYGQLLNLFAAQQDLIFKRKPNEVLELSSKIHAQVEILETRRSEREAKVRDFAISHGLDADSTLRSMVQYFDAEARPLLVALIADVNLLIHRVRRSLRLNHRLLSCMVDSHQAVLKRVQPDSFNTTYSAMGRVTSSAVRSEPRFVLAG